MNFGRFVAFLGPFYGKTSRHLAKIPRYPEILRCLGFFTACLGVEKGCGESAKNAFLFSISSWEMRKKCLADLTFQ